MISDWLIQAKLTSDWLTRNFTLEKLRELDGKEIGHLIHHVNAGHNIKRAAEEMPLLEIEVRNQPITAQLSLILTNHRRALNQSPGQC